jgi:hypothetical protein
VRGWVVGDAWGGEGARAVGSQRRGGRGMRDDPNNIDHLIGVSKEMRLSSDLNCRF